MIKFSRNLTKDRIRASLAILALASAGLARAQTPDGRDIATAIPYQLGQVATGIGDPNTNRLVVYSVRLARGQQVNLAADRTTDSGGFGFYLLTPQTLTFATRTQSQQAIQMGCCQSRASDDYDVPATGIYYIALSFVGSPSSTRFQMIAKAIGTPVDIPNPPSAGCLAGRVDSITYSLQRIAAGLPDEVIIGGTRACASCAVKPPLYPEIASRLESAVKSNFNVEACYDSAGNMFQIKLIRP